MKTNLNIPLSILLVAAAGCKLSDFAHPLGGKVATPERMAIDLPRADAIAPPDDETVTGPEWPPLLITNRVTLKFDTVEPVNAWGIDVSTDMVTWHTVYSNTPHLWIGLGAKQVTLTSIGPNTCFRAWVRNEP